MKRNLFKYTLDTGSKQLTIPVHFNTVNRFFYIDLSSFPEDIIEENIDLFQMHLKDEKILFKEISEIDLFIKNISETHSGRIFGMGDSHGDFIHFEEEYFPEIKDLGENDHIIVLGDFGFIFNSTKDPKLTSAACIQEAENLNRLANLKCNILFVDGNHENFDRIKDVPEIPFKEGKAGVVFDNGHGGKILHLKRGEIYIINGKKILTLGGAKSFDGDRKEGIDYWKEEELSQEDKDRTILNLKKHNFEVDLILSHNCAMQVGMHIASAEAGGAYNFSAKKFDFLSSKANDSTALFFEELLDMGLKAEACHFGHYHTSFKMNYRGIDFICHSEGEVLELLK